MKLISFYKENFSALKGHWKVVLLTMGLDLGLAQLLTFFYTFIKDSHVLLSNFWGQMISTPLCIAILVMVSLFCHLPLFLSFAKIPWHGNRKGCLRMIMKMLPLSILSATMPTILQIPSTLITFAIDSVSKTNNYSNSSGLFFVTLFLHLLSLAYSLFSVCIDIFMTFAYLIGSYWVVIEDVSVRTIFKRLWKIVRRKKKAFLKYGKEIWRAMIIPYLTGLFFFGVGLALLLILIPKNPDFLANFLIINTIVTPLWGIISYFAWPFSILALLKEKNNKELRFLYFN